LDWLEITIAVDPDQVEPVADVLRAGSQGGVSIERPIQHSDEETAFPVPGQPALVRAYLPIDGRLASRRRALQRALSLLRPSIHVPRARTRVVNEEGWAGSWKDHFFPERVGRLLICPAWRRCRPRPGELLIKIDPGMAFGTGQHSTTRMCLMALQERLKPGDRALDLGTGSGILAIAAAMLGARETVALDIDPVAAEIAAENAAANAVSHLVRVGEGSLGAAWPFADDWRGSFDCVVANIASPKIIELARSLVEALSRRGFGVAAGIGDERSDNCRRALEEAGARITTTMSEGDWRTLLFEAT